ncbi:methyltransferase domain-containing protein [bacterium SCSIO 12741]|nr:methyltransferase domain-containing protein [bacterium SCSIO 12741]
MDDKHYNATYLEDTEKLLIGLKKASYGFLQNLEAGPILELGCGTGSDALQLAQFLGDQYHMTGVDHDPSLLAHGREAAIQAGIQNLDFMEGSAENLPFEENHFQGIRAERLIQHLPNPAQVFKEIHRTLKEDGKVVLVETDWSGLTVYNSDLKTERKFVDFLTHKQVNFGLASREIGLLLHNQGFRNIQWVVKPFVIHQLEAANKYIMFDKMLMSATNEGFLTEDERSRYLELCQQLDNKDLFACSMSMVTYQADK